MEKGSKSKVEFRRVVAPEPISEPEQQTAEIILAHLIALAYAADHLEQFPPGGAAVALATTPSDSVVTSEAPD
jgi:hypothetical protein